MLSLSLSLSLDLLLSRFYFFLPGPPTVTVPSVVRVNMSNSWQFTCTSIGAPAPRIEILKGDLVVSSVSAGDQLVYTEAVASSISSGDYTCRAVNALGRDNKTVQVIVQSKS